MPYSNIEDWFKRQEKLILEAWDNIHLVTGEEGSWKSLWMRKCARRLDSKFSVDHIHFTQDDFLNDAAGLEPGRAIVLDEFRGHRRLAMHGDRMEFLDFTKECRELSLHIFIGFPHVSQFERDLLNSRIRWWEHKPTREEVQIRQRVSHLGFDKTGEPMVNTTFPLVGRFLVTGKNDPLRPEYQSKKEARMRDRAARFRENHGDKAPPKDPAAQGRINMALVSLAQAELAKAGI